MSVSILKPSEAAQQERPEIKHEAKKPSSLKSDILRGVRVELEARLGSAVMTVEEMMGLAQGSGVKLESGLADNVGLYLNGTLVAQGEIVAVGAKYGVRITDILPT